MRTDKETAGTTSIWMALLEPRKNIVIFSLCLLVVMGFLFRWCFHPDYIHFSNDGPLGLTSAAYNQPPGNFTGIWSDLNWLGHNSGRGSLGITNGLHWLLGSVWFAKVFAPFTLLFPGFCAWFFFRQLRLGNLAATVGGLAAALTPDFFGVACWGVGTQAICFGLNYLALGLVVSPHPLRPWIRYPLAGLAVGMGVTEAYDIGAIFSVITALGVVVHALLGEGPPMKRLLQGGGRVAIIAVFAAFISAAAVSSLIGTQIKGVVGTEQDQQTKQERWDWATQWSYPKAETLNIVVPGLFGYRMDTPDGGAYWGFVGRDPSWDRYFADGKQGQPPRGPIRYGGGSSYAGIMVLLVAAWAVAQSFRREKSVFSVRERQLLWFWAALAGVSLLLAYGRFAPFYQLFYALPYASTIRNPVKFIHVLQWALLVIFAYGLGGLSRRYLTATAAAPRNLVSHVQAWWARADGFDRKWVRACLVLLAVSVLGWLIYASSRQSLERYLQEVMFDADTAKVLASFSVRQVGWFIALLAAAAGLLVVTLSGYFSGRKARIGAVLLGVFVVMDLARVGSHWVNTYNWKEKYVAAADNGVIEFLRQKPHEQRVTVWPFSLPGQFAIIQQMYGDLWLQHLFQYYNIQSLDIIQMSRMPQDVAAFEGALTYDNTPATLHRVVRRWQLTNSRYLIGAAGLINTLNTEIDPQQRFKLLKTFDFAPKPGVINPTRFEQLAVVESPQGRFALFEFTGALPRAKLYSNWLVSTNDEATLTQLANKEFDPAQTVMVAEPLPVVPNSDSASTNAGTVEFVSYAPKHIVLRANATAPAVLLLNDKHDPNWQVTVDGQPAELLRCNYIMRGVFLEPGEHTVEFQFRPPVDALYISLVAIVFGVLLTGIAIVSIRKRPGAPSVLGNKTI
ncbi:MAG: hypothetical protein IH623_26790 [Verrucomicrobia bacterium]|nr:hypothetical protein [Verrucomicrobiota bacterium]